jgi:2-C-methyl-D-erythritol 4-phosphate cytidylyltransferase
MQKHALIVAGGSGTRMKSDLPKQFISLNGMPILMHTLKAFSFNDVTITLVLPEAQMSFWKELCQKHAFFLPHQLVPGGLTRFESVKNGLSQLPEMGLVAIHDGVRPIIAQEIIEASFTEALLKGNAIVSVPLKDSIREVSGNGNRAVERANYRLIQTPQTFQLPLIKKAFETPYSDAFTDDASVLEHAGEEINLIEGDYHNIKVTTPEDLMIAESFLTV